MVVVVDDDETGSENPVESRNDLKRTGAPRTGTGRWKVKEEDEAEDGLEKVKEELGSKEEGEAKVG